MINRNLLNYLRVKIHIFYTESSLFAFHECPTVTGVNLPQNEVQAIYG